MKTGSEINEESRLAEDLLAERDRLKAQVEELRGALEGMVREFGYGRVHGHFLVHDEHAAIQCAIDVLAKVSQ